jgi:hypothetical protein
MGEKNGKWKMEDGKGKKKQTTTVLSLSDGRDSGNQTDRGPAMRPCWFFDIYIQKEVKTTF